VPVLIVEGFLSRPFSSRHSASSSAFPRINGKIRAREVRVIGIDGRQLGILALAEAIQMARANGVDLVEVAATATPPVCKLIDYGKYRYELSKKERDSRKHQHSHKVKEIQLSSSIDPHDFGVKLGHAIDFLCEDMKVKVSLRFRGREMAHQEFGFQVVNRFLTDLASYGHADAEPKLNGRSINVMISPLPRGKRAKNPRADDESGETALGGANPITPSGPLIEVPLQPKPGATPSAGTPGGSKPGRPGFSNNPFASLDLNLPEGS
jgi:translation initiation factor IF-3